MELQVFGAPCTSTRKTRQWLQTHNIPFKYKNIEKNPLTIQEFRHILHLTEEGTDDLIATRSKAYNELALDVDALPLKELYEFIYKYPRLLRQPIIVGDNKLQVGFDEHDIRQFIPREDRREFLTNKLATN